MRSRKLTRSLSKVDSNSDLVYRNEQEQARGEIVKVY